MATAILTEDKNQVVFTLNLGEAVGVRDMLDRDVLRLEDERKDPNYPFGLTHEEAEEIEAKVRNLADTLNDPLEILAAEEVLKTPCTCGECPTTVEGLREQWKRERENGFDIHNGCA